MLMLFPTIKVPGLDDIEIFPDHEKHDVFYALRGRPSIATDEKGNPQLSFNFFSRNAEIAYASSANKELVETQLGQLLFTTDLAISKEEHDTITNYLASLVSERNNKFITLVNKLRKSKLQDFNVDRGNKPIIKLGTPNTWKEGTAKLELLEGLGDTFKKQSSSEVNPSLNGSNSASFYATFGIEGAQVYYDALTKGFSGEGDDITPLQAIVRYDLKGFAFVPNMEVKVTGSSTQIYDYMQEYREDYHKSKRGSYKVKTSGALLWKKKTITDSRSVYASKTDISKLVEEMIDRKVINIEITDFGDVAANSEEVRDIENSLRSTLMDTIMNTILPNFFETAFIGESKPDDGTEEGGGTMPSPNPDMGVSHADKQRPTVNTHYYFRSDIDKTKVSTLNFNFKKNGTVEFRRYPNGTLLASLTEEQRKQLVRHIDVSSPEVQILTVQVGVNADFTNDNIHSIIVNMSYSERDHKSGVVRENSRSFLYKTGDEINTFRVTMARNAKGELIDLYKVVAKISYIGTADSPPPIELTGISDRSLIISYDKLGFISVNCIAGDIDWTLIKDAIVNLEYPAASNQPDTKKEIRLSAEKPNGSWRCFMYGNLDKSYQYKVRYIHKDGHESESEVKTDTRDTLLIDDLLTGRAKASFDIVMDTNTVKTAKVEVLYEDAALGLKEEFSHWFNQTESWDWSMRLHNGATDTFKYRYFAQFNDDIIFTSPWKEARTDEDIPPIHLRRYPKTLTIDGGLIDWSVWQVVYVSVRYADEEYNYNVHKNIRLDKNTFFMDYEVLAFRNEAKPFMYSLKFAKAGSSPIAEEEKENTTGLLIIETPQI
jgi:hypothetical protein